MTADEVDHTVMRPPKPVVVQNAVRIAGEVAVGEEQQLDRLAQLVFPQEQGIRSFYVSHVDISGSARYVCTIRRDRK